MSWPDKSACRMRRVVGNRIQKADLPIMETSEATIFRKIWFAIFLSATATFLMLISLSSHAIDGGDPWLVANLIVLTQWIPGVVALPFVRQLCRRFSATLLLQATEILGLMLYPLIVAGLGRYDAVIGILLAKGTLDAIAKVGRPVALRDYLTGTRLDRAAASYNVAALSGAGIGSLVGALAFARLEIAQIASICMAMHGVAALLYLSLPRSAVTADPHRHRSAGSLPLAVRRAMCLYAASVMAYQGYHNIVRGIYPVEVLGMAPSATGIIQSLASFGYIAGAILAARMLVRGDRYLPLAAAIHLATAFAMIALPLIGNIPAGLALYAAFAVLFEIGFCLHLRIIVVESPASRLGDVVANANAWAMGSMVAISLVGSAAIARIGLAPLTLMIFACAIGLLVAVCRMTSEAGHAGVIDPGSSIARPETGAG